MSEPVYDVVIAGAGYAGLAAAGELGARALLIDQHAVGAIQRSACAMPLASADRFDARDAILQVYPSGFVHTPYGTTRFALDPPYCIFDHAALCHRLFERSGAAFLRARVRGIAGDTVVTTAGSVRGRLFIDASGWPAALATARRPDLAMDHRLTVGIEAEVPGRAAGIHFWFDRSIVHRGYAWVFPAGETLRVGVATYDAAAGVDLAGALQRFLRGMGLDGRPVRGGRIPWFTRPATIGNVFLTGDAAGLPLPLTAEGIRFALHYGALAGRIARAIVDGERSLAEGSRAYEQAGRRHRRRAAVMRWAQRIVGPMQHGGIHLAAEIAARPGVASRLMQRHARWSEELAWRGA